MTDVTGTPQVISTDAGQNLEAPPEEIPSSASELPVPLVAAKTLGLAELIRHWNPMGYRVVVNLPFIGNDRDFMFLIRPQPHIPWIPGMETYSNYLSVYDFFRPIIHDNDRWPNSNLIPPGIYITQHSPPPLLAELAWFYRRWRGSMKYRMRVVTDFTASGYAVTTFMRRVIASRGRKDFMINATPIFKVDSSYNQGMYNAWVSSDYSMFRHTEICVPFEYLSDWRDTSREVEQIVSDNTGSSSINRFQPNLDNFVGVGLRGDIAASDTSNKITIEFEYAAGDDFEFSMPIPPSGNWAIGCRTPATGPIPADDVFGLLAFEGLTIPNDVWTTNGTNTITRVTNRDETLPKYDQVYKPNKTSILAPGIHNKISELSLEDK